MNNPAPSDTPLSAVDLNLFLVLHTVLSEGSVTRAARRLSVTQSAVSNALARLRELFGDPLVVRHGRGLVPTPRAQALAPVMADAMRALQTAIDGGAFNAEASTRRFTVGWSDAQSVAHLPALLARFSERLPRATLRVVTVDYLVATDGLAKGDVDVAIGPVQAVVPPCLSEPLYDEGISVVVRRDHPLAGARLTRRSFEELRFVDIHLALGRGGVGNLMMQGMLARHGLTWRVGLVVPEFTAAAHAVAASDFAVGLPTRAARAFCELLPLRLIELPSFFGSPLMTMALIWHPRTDADPGSRFFRSIVAEACRHSADRPRRASTPESRRSRAIHGPVRSKPPRAPSSAG